MVEPLSDLEAGLLDTQLLSNHIASFGKSRAHSGHQKPDQPARKVDYDKLYSKAGKARQPGALTAVVSAFGDDPDIIGMHGGLPHEEAFPFASFTVGLKDGTRIHIDDPAKVADAQQYNIHVKGYPPLYQWAFDHVQRMHAPPAGQDVMISNGSNHTIEVVTSLLMDRGDSILCEEFTYFYMIDSVVPTRGYKAVPVEVDQFGMSPTALRKVLQDMQRRGEKLPRLLYTVPVGQNPTGAATPGDRKREIYKICQEYEIIVVEDDAYYYLQYPSATGDLPGVAGLGPSYLSLDTDGRVVRLDSFSKLLAPGFRLGWVTADPQLLDKMTMALHASLNGPCSVTQVLLAELMQQWGETGFEAYARRMQGVYRRRAAVLHEAATQELTGLAEWQRPTAGMFLWMKLTTLCDVDEILEQLVQQKVVVLPGRIAHCQGPRTPFACPYIRLSFASASEEDMRTGIKRLANILRSAPPRAC
ncbi:hypothetical protein WJX72_011180 [[Myrmecia] bisecta]|uniref:Aminotransferase class I/classII large domain-containing protein n=1 Tax=[Myrmecia] bisecta TaxID=41462 RepID=A0AAW1QTQ3_9CHLO